MDARLSALLAVTDRIDDQVYHHLTDIVLVGQHPERRRQVFGPFDRNLDPLFVGLHLGLLGDLLGQRNDVEPLHLQAVHVAFEFGDRIEVVHDVDQTVDALFGPFEVFAVDQLVLQSAVQQRRDISLNIEDRGFQLMRHIAEVLFAELLGLLQAGDLLVVGIGPRRKLLADILDVLVLQFGENLVGVHVARKDDRIDRLELVGHVLADDEQRHESHDDENAGGGAERHPPDHIEQGRRHGDDDRSEECDQKRRPLLCFNIHHSYFVYCCMRRAMYLPTISNSRFTTEPTSMRQKFVCSNV